ncbi:hypothetical protein DPMN_175938 [Dreissena polymorpha]|uniref:C2H2-type domain-containing protein n=1 Tax=Dreissena polymorpha TaxID=45954 RepID=A0A9D4E7F4_DREPO|nr:hypothetical protein DPMN_175938 [Dreissena polymorpha]
MGLMPYAGSSVQELSWKLLTRLCVFPDHSSIHCRLHPAATSQHDIQPARGPAIQVFILPERVQEVQSSQAAHTFSYRSKPYKCHKCSRTFVSNGVLKSHLKVHTGVKSYKCVMCEALFSTSGSLKRHMSTHSDFKTNVEQHETVLAETEGEYVEEEAVDNDLTLTHHNLHGNHLSQQAMLNQTNLQELGLSTTNLDQHILNQQEPVFHLLQLFGASKHISHRTSIPHRYREPYGADNIK